MLLLLRDLQFFKAVAFLTLFFFCFTFTEPLSDGRRQMLSPSTSLQPLLQKEPTPLQRLLKLHKEKRITQLKKPIGGRPLPNANKELLELALNHPVFSHYSKKQKIRLMETVQGAFIGIAPGRYTLYDGGPLVHAAQKPSGDGKQVICIGEKTLTDPRLSNLEIAHLLLDEAQHILDPEKRPRDESKEIRHDTALLQKLSGFAAAGGEKISEYPASAQMKKASFLQKIGIRLLTKTIATVSDKDKAETIAIVGGVVGIALWMWKSPWRLAAAGYLFAKASSSYKLFESAPPNSLGPLVEAGFFLFMSALLFMMEPLLLLLLSLAVFYLIGFEFLRRLTAFQARRIYEGRIYEDKDLAGLVSSLSPHFDRPASSGAQETSLYPASLLALAASLSRMKDESSKLEMIQQLVHRKFWSSNFSGFISPAFARSLSEKLIPFLKADKNERFLFDSIFQETIQAMADPRERAEYALKIIREAGATHLMVRQINADQAVELCEALLPDLEKSAALLPSFAILAGRLDNNVCKEKVERLAWSLLNRHPVLHENATAYERALGSLAACLKGYTQASFVHHCFRRFGRFKKSFFDLLDKENQIKLMDMVFQSLKRDPPRWKGVFVEIVDLCRKRIEDPDKRVEYLSKYAQEREISFCKELSLLEASAICESLLSAAPMTEVEAKNACTLMTYMGKSPPVSFPDLFAPLLDQIEKAKQPELKHLVGCLIHFEDVKIPPALRKRAVGRLLLELDKNFGSSLYKAIAVLGKDLELTERDELAEKMLPYLEKDEVCAAFVLLAKPLGPTKKSKLLLKIPHMSVRLKVLFEDSLGELDPEFPGIRLLVKLREAVDHTAQNHPPMQNTREAIIKAIQNYNVSLYADYYKTHSECAEDYEELTALLRTVHDNFPLVLNAIANMKMRVTRFKPLRQALPVNHPLTRIVRMMGERKNIVGGHLETVEAVIKSGQFGLLFDYIVGVAGSKRRQAPQEISGMLEIVGEMNKSGALLKWTRREWENLFAKFKSYYQQGFKVITLKLFKYYLEKGDDPRAIEEFRRDIKEELSNVGWGGFYGLTEEFRKKYGLGPDDELSLLAKYIPIGNHSAKDYAGKYQAIKRVLQSRGEAWSDEVDIEMRALFTVKGSKSQTSYAGSAGEREKLDALMSSFLSYLEGGETLDKAFAEWVREPKSSILPLKRAAVKYLLAKSGVNPALLKDPPRTDEQILELLNLWQRLLADTWKLDCRQELQETAKKVFAAMADQPAPESGREGKFKYITLDELKKYPKAKKAEIARAIANHDLAGLDSLLMKHWIEPLKGTEILDPKLVDRPKFAQFIRKFAENVKKSEPVLKDRRDLSVEQISKRMTAGLKLAQKNCIKENGAAALKDDAKRWRVVRESQAVQKLLHLFEEELEEANGQLKKFETVASDSNDRYFAGFFDDLLHLMSFMMSGVCTWVSRDEQVAETSNHFGKIALKTETGRVVGVSQVQLLRAEIRGVPARVSPAGWKTLSLPGINLFEGSLDGIDKGKAVFAILECAQRLAREAGMSGAVIPVAASINSNQEFVHRFIAEWAGIGWLKKTQLASTVKLSNTPSYTYSEVYLIQIPEKDYTLQKTEIERKIQEDLKKEERQDRETGLLFGEGVGEAVTQNGAPATVLERIKSEAEAALGEMAPGFLDELRSTALKNMAVRINVDMERDSSYIDLREKEAELLLGKDVLAGEAFDSVRFRDLFAELLLSVWLGDYAELKDAAATNENAYFKLEILKALLNQNRYLEKYHHVIHKRVWGPSCFLGRVPAAQRERILSGLKGDLDRFTKGMKRISQWNLFLNVMDDADPDFLISNYLHLLKSRPAFDAAAVDRLIQKVRGVEVAGKPSISSLRNAAKDFLFDGKVYLNIGGKTEEKEKFDFFDSTEAAVELKDGLLTAANQNQFYDAMQRALRGTGLLEAWEEPQEILRLVDNRLYEREDRESAVQAAVEELFVRKIGKGARGSIGEHLKARRGFKNIPYFEICREDLAEGTDADEYGFLTYARNEQDYQLSFTPGDKREEETPDVPVDWVHSLFAMPDDAQQEESPDYAGAVLGTNHAEVNAGLGQQILSGQTYLLDREGESGAGLRLRRIRDDQLLNGLLENAVFSKYSVAQRRRLAETAARVPLMVVKDRYSLFSGGPFAHARRGVSGGFQAIWIGEETLLDPAIPDFAVAMLLLEEAQHLLFPGRKHGTGEDQITHDGALRQCLVAAEISRDMKRCFVPAQAADVSL